MHAYRIVWEDEAKAREVEVYVHYTLEAGVVSVESINPVKVTLYDAHTKQPSRVLPVHTLGGRKLLTQAYLASRETEQTLEEEILAAHDLLDDAVAVG